MHASAVLNKIFSCKRCRKAILFESEKEDHTTQTGHSSFDIYNLDDIESKGLKTIIAIEKQTDKEDYWRHELRSLGIEPKRKNELNDKKELAALADNIKQVYYQDYKAAYSESEKVNESDFDYIV